MTKRSVKTHKVPTEEDTKYGLIWNVIMENLLSFVKVYQNTRHKQTHAIPLQ